MEINGDEEALGEEKWNSGKQQEKEDKISKSQGDSKMVIGKLWLWDSTIIVLCSKNILQQWNTYWLTPESLWKGYIWE